jgi:DNA-binding response OmpR family regulator
MQVELVQWPAEQDRLIEMREEGAARLVLVAEGAAPPLTTDVLEDWIRLPASEEDIESRLRVLDDRVRANGDAVRPRLDENGLLHFGGRWVPLPPVEMRLVGAMLDRYRAVVSREALSRAGWPDSLPGRNVLDVHIVRLRRRLADLGLVIRTVRSRGYLLEEAATEPATRSS